MAKITVDYCNLPYLQAKLTVAKRIRAQLPAPIPWIEGSINTLYQEIAECLVFGFNHSAITLMGGFFEHVLRLAIYQQVTTAQLVLAKANSSDLSNDPIWRWLEGHFTLVPLVKEARKLGLLKEAGKWWDEFPNKYRNPYSHFKICSAVKNEIETALVASSATECEEVAFSAQQNRHKWAIHKMWKDENESLQLFREGTQRFTEIMLSMKWTPQEPVNQEETYLAARYKNFFTDNWDAPENAPKFMPIADDRYIHWGLP